MSPDQGPLFLNLEYFYFLIYDFIVAGGWYHWLSSSWFGLRLVSFAVATALLGLIVYLTFRIVELRGVESAELKRMLEATVDGATAENKRWQKILDQSASSNSSDWKLAIIEADTMLDELLKTMKPVGESIGDRLKQIEASDFRTLDSAWAAHKVRNRIAHEPGYELSEREARETIANYRAVFEEFSVI